MNYELYFISLYCKNKKMTMDIRQQTTGHCWLPANCRRLTIVRCLLSFVCLFFVSCRSQYMVKGSSSVDDLEGKMLTLKVYIDGEMRSIDSTRVVHGRFNFGGGMDSTMLANVFLGNMSLMPIVLEEGEVKLNIGETQQSATGTPLNDTLSGFILRKTQIDARMAELPHLESQMIMDGTDYEEIMYELGKQSRQLAEENDELITRFIRANYNNVLGPGIFMILTSNLPYPILTPQIEEIITNAPPYFLGHPYVKKYIKEAQENLEKDKGY